MSDDIIYLMEALIGLIGSLCFALAGITSLKKDSKYRINQLFALGIFLLSFGLFIGILMVLEILGLIPVIPLIYFNFLRAIAILCITTSAFFFVLTGKSLEYGEGSLFTIENKIYLIVLVILSINEIFLAFYQSGQDLAVNFVLIVLAVGLFIIYVSIFLYNTIKIFFTLTDSMDPRKTVRRTIKLYIVSLLGLGILSLGGWLIFTYDSTIYTLLVPTGGTAVFGLTFFIFTIKK